MYLILYFLIIISIGINFIILMNKFKCFKLKKVLNLEIISLILTSGTIILTLYIYIIGMIGVIYEKYIFIPIFVGTIVNIIYISYKVIHNFKKINFNIKITKRNLLRVVLVLSNLIYIVYFFSIGISSKLIYPDEFSVWGLNAKNIFLGKKLTFFINTGLENYPNLLPLLYSGLYILMGKLQENLVRGFSAFFLLINLLNVINLCKRRKVNIDIGLIMLLFVYSKFPNFQSFSSSTYADIPFMTLYTCGIMYFIEWILNPKNREVMLISMVNMIGVCWCKQDGKFLVVYNIFILIIMIFLNTKFRPNEKNKLTVKKALVYSCVILIVPITWKIWTTIAKYPTELVWGAGSKVELHLEYVVSLMQNMTNQFFQNYVTIVLSGIIISGLFINFYKLNTKEKIYIVIAIGGVIANIVFLIVCYVFVFQEEALEAASFIRYYSRTLMMQIMVSLVLLKPIISGYERKEIK